MADWAVIVREHGPMAFDAAWRVLGHAADAEDVVQEALMHALRMGERERIVNWGGLLRHLTVRRAIDRLRQHLTRRGEWSDGQQADLQADVDRQVLTAMKEAESYGTLLDGRVASAKSIFEGVFEEMPDHLRHQQEMLEGLR